MSDQREIYANILEEATPTHPLSRYTLDRAPLRFVSLSAAIHIAFMILVMSMPESRQDLELDLFSANDRFAQLALTPDQQIPEPLTESGAAEVAEASAKHAGDEGKAGSPTEQVTHKKLAIKGNEVDDLQIKKARDIEIAHSAGIAAELQVSSLWGNSHSSVGADALHALGELDGAEVGNSKGFGGLGLSDAGRGGGGVREGSIGLSDLATDGIKKGRRAGRDTADLGEPDGKIPAEVTWKDPILDGGLDREIIQRVVRQNRAGIKACYEQELQKSPGLSGEVTMAFTIGPRGDVLSVSRANSTLNHTGVEQCVMQRIRRWVFPEPKGGSIVKVRYPFRFFSP